MKAALIQYRFQDTPAAELYRDYKFDNEGFERYLEENLPKGELVAATFYQPDIDQQNVYNDSDATADTYFNFIVPLESPTIITDWKYRRYDILSYLQGIFTGGRTLVTGHHVSADDHYFTVVPNDFEKDKLKKSTR